MISRRITLRMKNVSGLSCRETQHTRFMFPQIFFTSRAVYEIIVEEYGTAGQTPFGNIVGRIRFACWIPEAEDRHSEYIIKVKVKCSRYRPGVAQRVGRGIALLFHDRGTRRGWVVSSTPRPHYTTGIRSRTVQPVAQSLYRLSYPAQQNI